MKKWFISGVLVIVVVTALMLYLSASLANPANNGMFLVLTNFTRESAELNEIGEGGGTLVLAVSGEPAVIDPQGAASLGLEAVLPYLFDTLVVRQAPHSDAPPEIIPSLAESWQVAPDGSSVTFKLKSGAVFHDGNPLNADAVRLTFERFKRSGTASPIYPVISQIQAIDPLDDWTVRFTIPGRTDDLLNALATPYAALISPESLQGDPDESHLVGSGPYMMGEWNKGEALLLTRFNGYFWGPAIFTNRMPPYSQVLLLKIIPDTQARLAALQARQVDALLVDRPEDASALKGDPGLRVDAQGLAYRKGVFGLKVSALGQLLVNDARVTGNY